MARNGILILLFLVVCDLCERPKYVLDTYILAEFVNCGMVYSSPARKPTQRESFLESRKSVHPSSLIDKSNETRENIPVHALTRYSRIFFFFQGDF